MGTLFEDLQQGLQEAIDYEKGIGKARTIIICFRIILIVECGMWRSLTRDSHRRKS